MQRRAILFLTITLGTGGCGGGAEPDASSTEEREPVPRRETVFDPMTSTIGRAQSVQQTLDEQAAEQRRRIEEAER